jgi:flagellar L-ring protein precursor FlgH
MVKNIIKIMLVIPVLLIGQDMSRNSQRSLFSDYKAARVGDAITILVVESSRASNEAETQAGRESEIGLGASGGVGSGSVPNTDMDLSTGNQFKGSGSTKTYGMVKTKISARVDSVLANGNLRINGSRRIVINGEEQTMKVNGIVRVSDIQADNTVYSYNISDADIEFEGSGMIERSQSPGWLTKLFHWLF